MKLILASFFEEENHGPGRKIGICPKKPTSDSASESDFVFRPLDPGQLYWDYHKYKKDDPKMAGEAFVEAYRKQCEEFVSDVKMKAEKDSVSIFDILPFKDGDTLLTWEKKGSTSYRAIAAEYLRELGYDVTEN